MEKLKAFLSSTMTELHNERMAVQSVLTEQGIEVIWFESFGARPETPQAAYLKAVQEADIYIGIFWNQYSPATEEEYHEAERLGKPCFIYVKVFAANPEAELEALVKELRQKHVYKTFPDVLILSKYVQADLHNWMVDQWRQFRKQQPLAERKLKEYDAQEQRLAELQSDKAAANETIALLQDHLDKLTTSPPQAVVARLREAERKLKEYDAQERRLAELQSDKAAAKERIARLEAQLAKLTIRPPQEVARLREPSMALQRFIDRRVASPLTEAFEEMMSTATGRRLAESSDQRRARYILDPTGKLGSSAMSINLLRLAIIGKDALGNTPWLINSLAHEATHIEQGYISDSFEQEYTAFVTAARVMTELGLKDPFGWDAPELQSLSPEQAARKIMEFYPNHPLYGMDPAIPIYQVRGLRGLIELVKQGWALIRAA